MNVFWPQEAKRGEENAKARQYEQQRSETEPELQDALGDFGRGAEHAF